MSFVGMGVTARHSAVTLAPAAGWDTRLYDGLATRRIAPETRNELARALGAVGVEAEFLLVLVDALPGAARPQRDTGAIFLQRLTGSLARIVEASATLEVATQGYLTALEASYPGVERSPRDMVWWPAFSGYTLRGEPLEARLRRCGYAYRHAVDSRLPVHMEAILEQLALTVYALSTLPPAGVAPVTTLYHGLYELSSALHGDIVPRHILGASGDARYPGALASITRLRELNASGDISVESDLAWARAQYAAVSGARSSFGPAPVNARDLAATPVTDARLLAAHAAYEWGHTIGFLESLRRVSAAGASA
ncbi:MAG TPA: hypothetical protein VF812_15665 [Ktedonobacterales bacterium]